MKVQVLASIVMDIPPDENRLLKGGGIELFDKLTKRIKWRMATRWVRVLDVTDQVTIMPPKGEPELDRPRQSFTTDASTSPAPASPSPGPRPIRPHRRRKPL